MAINKKHSVILFFLFIFISHLTSYAQLNKYLIYFTDKTNSPYSLNNPSQFLSSKGYLRRVKQNISLTQQDLPVNPAYVDSLEAKGAQVLLTSKWFNAALVLADPSQVSLINALPFVKGDAKVTRKTKLHSVELTEINFRQSSLSMDYGQSYNQVSMLGIDQMHEEGFHGKGMLIAVIDGGFQNASSLSIFDSLYLNNRVLATYDFVDLETDVYDDHEHGTQVLSLMAAYEPGALIGGAWKANYLLLRSEDASSESLSEEVNWVVAAEYADSAGADIINSSLGYNTFDDPSANHVYADLDGNTTLISKAADIAASKGILVVSAAGNEGNNFWKYINAPSDGDSVLAVGAVNPFGFYYYNSSVGPSSDGRIKPDIAAPGNAVEVASVFGGTQAGSGTSFASPLIAGLAAGIWQAFPTLSNMELIYYLKRSGSQYAYPDYLLGYGIPHFARAKSMIAWSLLESISIFPNPVDNHLLILNLPIVEIGKEISLRFTDITGNFIAEEKILSGDLRNELSTRVYDWNRGIYLLTITTPEKKYVIKVLKN